MYSEKLEKREKTTDYICIKNKDIYTETHEKYLYQNIEVKNNHVSRIFKLGYNTEKIITDLGFPIHLSNYLEIQKLNTKKCNYNYHHQQYLDIEINLFLMRVREAVRKYPLKNIEIIFRILDSNKAFQNSYGADKALSIHNNSFCIAYDIDDFRKDIMHEFYNINNLNSTQTIKRIEKEIKKDLKFIDAPFFSNQKCNCIFSEEATGLITHECIGHPCEIDIRKISNLDIGKRIANENITIVDCGKNKGSGYVPFDDEGINCKKTILVKNGIVNSFLTDIKYSIKQDLRTSSGNSRFSGFSNHKGIRMTTTYMNENKMKTITIKGFNGIYIDTCEKAFYKNYFYLKPVRAYIVRNGKIFSPVNIKEIIIPPSSLIKETTELSNKKYIYSSLFGGCSKYDRGRLRVAFGGPKMKVLNINVE